MIYKIIDHIFLCPNINDLTTNDIEDFNIKTIFRTHDKNEKIINIIQENIKFYKILIEDNILYNNEIIISGNSFYKYLIDNPKRNVLITSSYENSCNIGLIVFYIITKYHINVEKSLDIIQENKSDIYLNHGFTTILNKYYKKLKKNNFIQSNEMFDKILKNSKKEFEHLVKNK